MSTIATTNTYEAIPTEVGAFMARLEVADKGELSRLKRNSGQSLAESRGVLPLFFRMLPGNVRPRDYETYFLIATLFPQNPKTGHGDFGQTMQRVRALGS